MSESRLEDAVWLKGATPKTVVAADELAAQCIVDHTRESWRNHFSLSEKRLQALEAVFAETLKLQKERDG